MTDAVQQILERYETERLEIRGTALILADSLGEVYSRDIWDYMDEEVSRHAIRLGLVALEDEGALVSEVRMSKHFQRRYYRRP